MNLLESESVSKAMVAGATSFLAVSAGTGLMFYNDKGMTVGRIIFGTGVSSGLNTVEHINSGKEFSYFEWLRDAGVRALNGTVAALCGEGGGLAAEIVGKWLRAAGLNGTVAAICEEGVHVAAETVGGVLSESISDILPKVYYRQDVTVIGVRRTARIGVFVGLAGAGVELVVRLVEKYMETSIVKRTVISTVAGGVTAALSRLIENEVERGHITKQDFIDDMVMEQPGVSEEAAKELWTLLCDNGIITKETSQCHLPDSLAFPEGLEHCRESVKQIIACSLNYSIWRGVLRAAAKGALARGITTGVAAGVRWNQRGRR